MGFTFHLFALPITIDLAYFAMPLQFLSAEMLFLYSYDRRKKFPLRLALGVFLYLLLSVAAYNLFPEIKLGSDVLALNALVQEIKDFLRVILLLALSMLLNYGCFKERFWTIISACMAGYAVQHFAYQLGIIFEATFPNKTVAKTFGEYVINIFTYYLPIYLPVYLASYTAAFFIFAKPAVKYDYKNKGNKYLNLLSTIVIVFLILINRFVSVTNPTSYFQIIANALYAMALCCFSLIIQFTIYRYLRLETEYETTQVLFRQNEQNYLQWKDSLEEINIRYHDLRHKLDFLSETGIDANSQAYQEIKTTLDNYSTRIRTGNDILDVLIAGKKSICRQADIEFSCMIDEKVLSCFDGMKLYNLLNNALDNAINYLKSEADINKRVMSMSAKPVGNAAFICIENYFKSKIELQEGLPVSTQHESGHGYGMKSMKRIVDSYNGTLTVSTINNMFNLSILLPFPDTDDPQKF